MRILITGAGGFVAGHLIRELLRAGDSVAGGTLGGTPPEGAVLGHEELSRVRWISLDITSDASLADAVRSTRPEIVFHLAAQSSVGLSFADPIGTWDVNATGTLRLLQALRDGAPGATVLIVSSAEVYGAVPEEQQPIRESTPLAPVNPYGASKAAAEMLALQAGASGRLQVLVARSFNHTGPGQDPRFSLPSFAQQLARICRGEAEPVLRVGNLEVRRDFLDVRDVVRAYLHLADHGESGTVYNVCSGQAQTLRAIVEQLVEVSGTGAIIEVDPERVRPVDIPLLVGDAGRIRALGWQPRIPLRQTLADMFAAAGAA